MIAIADELHKEIESKFLSEHVRPTAGLPAGDGQPNLAALRDRANNTEDAPTNFTYPHHGPTRIGAIAFFWSFLLFVAVAVWRAI